MVHFADLHAQKQPLAIKVFTLGNQARTNPALFLKQNQAELKADYPKFAELLARTKPLPAAIWDSGLEAMCKQIMDGSTLDPDYKGKNMMCGNASGMHGSGGTISPLEVLADFYANLLDPNCIYFGMVFDSKGESYWFNWGISCNTVHEEFTFTGKVDSSHVDFAKINTASKASYLSPLEKRMVLEVNFARAYPKVYAQIIAQYLHDRSHGTWGLDHDDYIAGVELIDELNAMQPAPILQPLPCIYEAAKIHGLDCAKRGFLDHTGSDGSAPWDRIAKQCPDIGNGNENLQGGSYADPRSAVISLLIDSGISDRGHRYNMLAPHWHHIGCYLIKEGSMRIGTTYNWVQNFGG